MIRGNTIYFGHGDVRIGHDFNGILEICQLTECVAIGENARDAKVSAEIIKLNPFKVKIIELKQVIYGEKKSFTFDGVTFDFSKYNPLSLTTVIDVVKRAQEVYGFIRAC